MLFWGVGGPHLPHWQGWATTATQLVRWKGQGHPWGGVGGGVVALFPKTPLGSSRDLSPKPWVPLCGVAGDRPRVTSRGCISRRVGRPQRPFPAPKVTAVAWTWPPTLRCGVARGSRVVVGCVAGAHQACHGTVPTVVAPQPLPRHPLAVPCVDPVCPRSGSYVSPRCVPRLRCPLSPKYPPACPHLPCDPCVSCTPRVSHIPCVPSMCPPCVPTPAPPCPCAFPPCPPPPPHASRVGPHLPRPLPACPLPVPTSHAYPTGSPRPSVPTSHACPARVSHHPQTLPPSPPPPPTPPPSPPLPCPSHPSANTPTPSPSRAGPLRAGACRSGRARPGPAR